MQKSDHYMHRIHAGCPQSYSEEGVQGSPESQAVAFISMDIWNKHIELHFLSDTV
jgi:hypothetical protein